MNFKGMMFSSKYNSPLCALLMKKDQSDVRERRIRSVNKVLTVLAGAMILFSLIRALLAYNSLPDELGVHFLSLAEIEENLSFRESFSLMLHGGLQPYDVTGPKLWIFYPHLIAFLLFAGSKLAVWLFGKVSKKSSMDDLTQNMLKQGLTLSLNIVVLDFCIYFCIIWNECILRQAEMRSIITRGYAFIALLCFLDLIFFCLVVNKYAKDKQK